MPEPLTAVLRKINLGNDCHNHPTWQYLTLFPDVVKPRNGWMPADNGGANSFRIDKYAETVALDFALDADKREYSHMVENARRNLSSVLRNGAIAHNREAVKARPILFCHEWKGGEK